MAQSERKKALRRKKAINIAASLAASGIPFNNESMSPEVFVAYTGKVRKQGETTPLTRANRKRKKN